MIAGVEKAVGGKRRLRDRALFLRPSWGFGILNPLRLWPTRFRGEGAVLLFSSERWSILLLSLTICVKRPKTEEEEEAQVLVI